MGQISRIVRLAVYNRITDSTLGYNQNVQTAVVNYPGVDANVLLVQDWTVGGKNFLYGTVNPDAIDESDNYEYPFCSIDTGTAANQNLVISAMFSGDIPVITNLHLSWLNAEILPNFAEYSDCAEEAFFESMNSVTTLLAGANYTYNGRTTCQKGQIQMAGIGWRRTLTFTSLFKVITN